MAKITFNTFASLANETSFIAQLNENFSDLVAQIDLLLSRDGEAPNTMIANLDMNSQRIINTLDGVDPQDTVSFSQLSAVVAGGLPVQTGNAGLFLTTNGSVTSWASTLPDQTGNAGFFLTTDGSTPSWAVGSFLPALVTNRLLSNDGATASWRLDFLLTTNSLAGDDATRL